MLDLVIVILAVLPVAALLKFGLVRNAAIEIAKAIFFVTLLVLAITAVVNSRDAAPPNKADAHEKRRSVGAA